MRGSYGSRADDAELRARLDFELGIINKMGFNTYFLIVWDLCQFTVTQIFGGMYVVPAQVVWLLNGHHQYRPNSE